MRHFVLLKLTQMDENEYPIKGFNFWGEKKAELGENRKCSLTEELSSLLVRA